MPHAEYASLTRAHDEECREYLLDAGNSGASGVEVRNGTLPSSHAVQLRRPLMRLFDGAKGATRLLVLLVYCFPMLLVPKIVLWAIGNPAGDYIALAFVVLVVITLFAVACLSLVHLIVGKRSERRRRQRYRLVLPTGSLAKLARTLELPQPKPSHLLTSGGAFVDERAPSARDRSGWLLIEGRIQAGLTPEEPVVLERWMQHERKTFRAFSGRSFAVVGDAQAPVFVVLERPPILAGPYEESFEPSMPAEDLDRLVNAMHEPSELREVLDGGRACVIREGQRVRLAFGPHEWADNRSHPALAERDLSFLERSSSYREGPQRLLLVRCRAESPVLIERQPG